MAHKSHDGGALILWGAYFDEVMATLFASALRRSGWRTSLVGLHGLAHTGRHGMTVVADLSLGEVLRRGAPIACIVTPCTPEVLRSDLDPRVGELLALARDQHALLVAEFSSIHPREIGWPENVQVVKMTPPQILDAASALIEALRNTC